MKLLSCGVLVCTKQAELLLCHMTGGRYWDIPKGLRDAGEEDLAAAVRETREECGLHLDPSTLSDLGVFTYRPGKDLHLFATLHDRVVPSALRCTSHFLDRHGRELPEVDAFAWVPITGLAARCAPNMTRVLTQALDLRALVDQLVGVQPS